MIGQRLSNKNESATQKIYKLKKAEQLAGAIARRGGPHVKPRSRWPNFFFTNSENRQLIPWTLETVRGLKWFLRSRQKKSGS